MHRFIYQKIVLDFPAAVCDDYVLLNILTAVVGTANILDIIFISVPKKNSVEWTPGKILVQFSVSFQSVSWAECSKQDTGQHTGQQEGKNSE